MGVRVWGGGHGQVWFAGTVSVLQGRKETIPTWMTGDTGNAEYA